MLSRQPEKLLKTSPVEKKAWQFFFMRFRVTLKGNKSVSEQCVVCVSHVCMCARECVSGWRVGLCDCCCVIVHQCL